MDWLQQPEAWRSLAEGERGLVRDWALTNLAVVAPDTLVGLPDEPDRVATVLAATHDDPVPALLEGLERDPQASAVAAELLGAFGRLPTDSSSLIEPLRKAAAAGGEGALYCAQTLCDLEALDGPTLQAAARGDAPETVIAVPVLAVRYAAMSGKEDDTARAVASQLGPHLAKASVHATLGVLALLGVPQVSEHTIDTVEGAAALGFHLSGSDARKVRAKGSVRRRSQKVIRSVLGDKPGAAAAMIRALLDYDLPWDLELVAGAMWVAGFDRSDDPVADVLERNAGESRLLLSQARAAITPDDSDRVRNAVETQLARRPTVQCVLPALDAPLRESVLDLYLSDAHMDARRDVVARVMLARDPEQIVQLLEGETRDFGLECAAVCPSEQVLKALLDLPVPADADSRVLYAYALACMGDMATVPQLRSLIASDDREEMVECGRLAEAITSTRICPG